MLQKIKKKTAQSTLEYAVLGVIIIGALIAMKTYLGQSIQGKMKDSSDSISAEQFNPDTTIYNKTTFTSGKTFDVLHDGMTTSTIVGEEITNVDVNSYTPGKSTIETPVGFETP